MATIDDLIAVIYHEKQEPGSMLCAQHALNNLLQENYFTAPDLSVIAHSLDEQEAQYDEANNGASTNMDDTGFFSVQVLENALQVWGLTLVRWRSESMRPYQDHPHTQLAFILNLQQHWYTLRRFGPASSVDAEDSVGHWFNLNSSLDAPEWVSKLYLGMVLQHAEAEGYSVFAVVQQDPTAPLALPRSPADQLAATIPEQPSYSSSTRPASSRTATRARGPEGFEDEDMELQAALQASLMGGAFNYPTVPVIPPSPPATTSARPGVLTPTWRHSQDHVPPLVEEDDHDDEVEEVAPVDPVAASMARNRAFLQRIQREQEAALREGYQDEMARVETAGVPRGVRSDNEDEMFLRAIAESEAMARAMPMRREEDDDEKMDDVDYEPPRIPQQQLPSMYHPHRVYDDEDAELQAALKASLESVPEGFSLPDTPPAPAPPPLPSASSSVPAAPAIQGEPSNKSESEGDVETESEAEQPAVEQLSMEEIRRRRLARFGG